MGGAQMLVLASIALITIVGSFALGSALLGWAQSRSCVQRGDQFFIAAWIGLLWVAGCLMAIAQFIPLNRFALVGMLSVMLLAAIVQRQYLVEALQAFSFGRNGRWALLALAVSAIGIAAITSRDVVHFDTGFYQLPQVIWLQEHGLVTGLGLLHHRFGYNSIWLALVAPIQDLNHDGRLVAIGSTIACTLLAFQMVFAASRIAAGDGRPADWFAVTAPLSGAVSAWLLSAMISSSPDIPIWTLTLLFGWILLIDRDRQLGAAAIMVAVGATAIKLSAAPLLIGAAVYAVWTRQLELRNCVVVGLFAALTLGSVVMANMITSGCLMFPAAATCLAVSWAIPAQTAKAVTQFISHWPLFGNINEFNATDIAQYADGTLAALPIQDRLRLIWAGANPLAWTLLATVAALACLAPRSLSSRARAVMVLIAIFGLAYCVTVPSYRFAAGWIGILAGLATITVVERLRPWLAARLWSSRLVPIAGHKAMALGAFGVLILGLALSPIERVGDRDLRESGFANRPTRLAERWLLPPTLVAHQPSPAKGMISGTSIPRSEPTQWIETRGRDLGFVRPQSGEQCWGIRLACAPPGEPFRPIALRDARRGITFGMGPNVLESRNRDPGGEQSSAARHDRIESQTQ
jgi:hypothetical protein